MTQMTQIEGKGKWVGVGIGVGIAPLGRERVRWDSGSLTSGETDKQCRNMKAAIQRWGNSLAVRIPRAFAAETRIRDGSEVEFSLKGGALVIRPVRRTRLALDDLLKEIKPSNRHEEITTGDPVGREVW